MANRRRPAKVYRNGCCGVHPGSSFSLHPGYNRGMIGERQVPWRVAAALIAGLLLIEPPIVGYAVAGRYDLFFMLSCEFKTVQVVVAPTIGLSAAALAILCAVRWLNRLDGPRTTRHSGPPVPERSPD